MCDYSPTAVEIRSADWETFRTQADIAEDMVSSGSIDEATPPFSQTLVERRMPNGKKGSKQGLESVFDVTLPVMPMRRTDVKLTSLRIGHTGLHTQAFVVWRTRS
ncbi:hypothetical protein TNCV_2933811 [Trichonephila clavipes]|nr:hypothetical protein TNCV_2933811 [Trichonephila clavipes]